MMIAFQGDIATKENQSIITNFFMFFKYLGLVTGVMIGGIFGIKSAYIIVFFIIAIIISFSYDVLKNTKSIKAKILNEI